MPSATWESRSATSSQRTGLRLLGDLLLHFVSWSPSGYSRSRSFRRARCSLTLAADSEMPNSAAIASWRQVVDVPQHDHGPQSRGQVDQRLVQPLPKLALIGVVLGIAPPAGVDEGVSSGSSRGGRCRDRRRAGSPRSSR